MNIIRIDESKAYKIASLVAEFRVALRSYKGIESQADIESGKEEILEFLNILLLLIVGLYIRYLLQFRVLAFHRSQTKNLGLLSNHQILLQLHMALKYFYNIFYKNLNQIYVVLPSHLLFHKFHLKNYES